ncbi:MAG: DUF3313 domain-containing protein [Rhizobiales bacterium]|nr:DUF3313 domain-containing protein [Hyphomicrobiales bacterium]
MPAPLGWSAPACMLASATMLSACVQAPLVQGSALSSYNDLAPSDGIITKSRLRVNQAQVLAAKTINIAPTGFAPTSAPKLTAEQRALVTNALNRAMCVSLSDRFEVVSSDQPADLTVRAVVTQAVETDEVAAGVSAAASIGTRFIPSPVPIIVPRLPIGLGKLSIEAEAVDPVGKQQAAMIWGRGAQAFLSSPKMSKAGDAYDLAAAFGDDFATLLVKGKSPFEGFDPSGSIPSFQKINSTLGLAPKYAVCERYGRAPGIIGFAGGKLGLPPEWTDNGGK